MSINLLTDHLLCAVYRSCPPMLTFPLTEEH